MGVDARRRPPLPAPTESPTLQTSGGSATDLATDVSRRSDHTSISIPEDGRPVVVRTKKRSERRDKDPEHTLTPGTHQSQTSLLIEYFEGGKDPNVHSKPSVRVKLTPSSGRKNRDSPDHIQITEAGSSRRPSYTKRISLGPKSGGGNSLTVEPSDNRSSISSYASATEESGVGRRPPVEIEVMGPGPESELSGDSVEEERRYVGLNASDISSMPPSILDMKPETTKSTRDQNRGLGLDGVTTAATVATAAADTLKTPARQRSRSISRERLTRKVIEKLESKPRTVSGSKHKHSSKARSRSDAKEHALDDLSSPKRRTSKHAHADELVSNPESSLLSPSQVSDRRKSSDVNSSRSGTSKYSLTNPKLIETVERAIHQILPELAALKQTQESSRYERERRDSTASGSNASREDSGRRSSGHRHRDERDSYGKPKVVLNQDENDPGQVLSGDSIRGKKEHRRNRVYDSPSDKTSDRGMSEETVIRDDDKMRKRSKDGHRLRDAAAAGVGSGALTHEALKHYDSKSSMERRERRKKRGKSHSRSVSQAESTEDGFKKHDIPPMPMSSDINGSELTRDSILSERTSTPTSERRRSDIRHVARSSPREVRSPTAGKTARGSKALSRGLGTHHSNRSLEGLNINGGYEEKSPSIEARGSSAKQASFAEAAAAAAAAVTASAGVIATDAMLDHHDEAHQEYSYNHHAQSRGLSPIQSVDSFQEREETAAVEPLRQSRSSGSLDSAQIRLEKRLSTRPQGVNLEDPKEVLEQHDLDAWYEQQHAENERYRSSMGDDDYKDSLIDGKRLTTYTDDSFDAPYLDRVTTAQQIRGIGANPEFIHIPVAVESAVASLHDSVADARSTQSGRSKGAERSYLDPPIHDRHGEGEFSRDSTREVGLDQHPDSFAYQPDTRFQNKEYLQDGSFNRQSAGDSPRQSEAQSLDGGEEPVKMGASGVPVPGDPLPEIGIGLDSESDINTNPSIIQGPIGGVPDGSRDHWPYEPTPPRSKGDGIGRSSNNSAQDSLGAAAAGMLAGVAAANATNGYAGGDGNARDFGNGAGYGEPLSHSGYDAQRNVNHEFDPVPEPFLNGQGVLATPMMKDEGYISGANPRSAGGLTPDDYSRGEGIFDDHGLGGAGSLVNGEDPFVSKSHMRHLSGNSHGMASPLYDSATGRGIDRIQSKDIVALMDHLTVRDAQRNARDTEILITLVRSAAEMRNSFEDMKRFIAQQDEIILETGNKQHERTQAVLNGPRPQPLGTPRMPRRSSAEDDAGDDLPTKRRNMFRRALKGLGGRSSNDLTRIEDMLVQLLGEVQDLKATKDVLPIAPLAAPVRMSAGLTSYENMRAALPEGYEPEDRAVTLSTGNQSADLANPSSRQPNRTRGGFDGRRGSQNRISTVLEGDEELDTHQHDALADQLEDDRNLLTPTRDRPQGGGAETVRLTTPPTIQLPTGRQSDEITPKTATDKSRKHKSSSSSFFPKISRWSKTTSSSAPETVRNSGRRERPFSEASRSGSELDYNVNEHYDPHGDDRLRSNLSVEDARPPSPLIPSQVSEKPQYQAHRDSQNLQHPQPRQGPTARYQSHLESQAQTYTTPTSPNTDQWGSNPTLARFAPHAAAAAAAAAANRYSAGAGNLSPISDAAYSELSSIDQAHGQAPPRPPKIKDDGPLVPHQQQHDSGAVRNPDRLAPVAEEQRYVSGSSTGYEQANGSPRAPITTGTTGTTTITGGAAAAAHTQPPTRKPTGPRPIVVSGTFGTAGEKASGPAVPRTRFRGSPNHVESSVEDVSF